MKIGLDLNNKAIREYTTPMMDMSGVSRTEKNSAARLDLSNMYAETQAYGMHGKSIDEVMSEAGLTDVELQRNYMTVMSNTMSGEDYKKAMEEGFDPSEMSGEESVTILDHIKAVMAESGQIIAGYNDNLDSSIMKEITGKNIDSATLKKMLEAMDLPATSDNTKKMLEAIGMMNDITELPEGSIKYMVDNDLDTTIGNIYTSRYSAMDDGNRQAKGYYSQDMSGYYAKKADTVNWEEMEPQVKKALEQMNLENIPEEEQLENAKWLLEKGLPITENKIVELSNINSIAFPVPVERVITASINAIAAGLEPKDGNLSVDNKGIYNKAFEQQKAIINATIGREEARLNLSIDANIRLIKQGISIDTDSIENVINSLKNEEEQLRREFFGDGTVEELDRKTELFSVTTNIVKELPYMPAAAIGNITAVRENFSIMDIHKVGNAVKAKYEQASQNYELMGTEVRKDLGDSINKAFRNVDDILRDLNLNLSDENRRAVRILGYNSMVINENEIKKIVQADNKIQDVIKGLTPGKTLQLIREGINPLDMDIDELVNHISEMDFDPKRDNEKYSKFLYKLEKSGEITEEEKESYIGIYRMLNRLEKTDHAAIGKLLDSNVNITFGNILTAMRSSGKTFNLSIDDNFGALSEIVNKGISISDQIEAAFAKQIGQDKNAELEKMYANEKMEAIRETANATEEVVSELLDNNASVSPNNIEAVIQFNEDANSFFRYAKSYSKRVDTTTNNTSKLAEKLDKDINDCTDNMTDRESAEKSYDSLLNTISDTLAQMSDIGATTLVDYKSISLMYKQISLAADYAKEENYHIPVLVNDRLTDVNVKLVHGDDSGVVTARVNLENYGTVKAEMRLNGNKLDAVFIGENRESIELLKQTGSVFGAELEKEGFEAEIRQVIGNPNLSGKYSEKNADINNETVDTKDLYMVARKFIQSIKTT